MTLRRIAFATTLIPLLTASAIAADADHIAHNMQLVIMRDAVNAGGVSGYSREASATPTAPPSGGGGGAMDWLALSLLASLRFLWSRRTSALFAVLP